MPKNLLSKYGTQVYKDVSRANLELLKICSLTDLDPEDLKNYRFTSVELQDKNIIKAITKNSFKDLAQFLGDGKGKMPVFGFPQPIFYSPREKDENSLWKLFYSDISQSLREGHKSLIREILDTHDGH